MSVKAISPPIAATLFASGSFAGQPSGRDAVYVEAGSSTTAESAPMLAGTGRASIYAHVSAPARQSNVKVAGNLQPGRMYASEPRNRSR
jgi:hypothetical protein